MPSPLAHASAGLGIYLASLPIGASPRLWEIGVVAFASVAPDLDILAGVWTGQPMIWHHGPSHSLFGAAALGAGLSAAVRGLLPRLAVAAACLSHVPLDWLTGDPAEALRYGVPLFWPLSGEKYIADWAYFGAFHLGREGFLLNLLAEDARPAWARELAFVGVVAALTGITRRLRAPRA